MSYDKKNLHINDSYCVWGITQMHSLIDLTAKEKYNSYAVELLLNRTYRSMYIEWWAHNIGYYLTLPFCKNEKIAAINLRFKHVDLEEWK